MPRLLAAAGANDAAAVDQIVDRFPQDARNWGETEFLNDWALATIHGDAGAASAKLQLARLVGEALRKRSGERLLADCVTSIAAASGPARLQLARGHRAYREGRLLYSRRRVAESSPLFDAAAADLAAQHSPIALMAELYRANVLYDGNRPADALRQIASLRRRAAAYNALRAQLSWTEGTILLNTGEVRAALTSYEAAYGVFDALGEKGNAGEIRNYAASALALLGRDRDAWRMFAEAFAAPADAAQLQVELTLAAQHAMRRGQWSVAWSFYSLALQQATSNGRVVANVRVGRAIAAWKDGSDAAPDLAAARAIIARIVDPAMRETTEADLDLADGITSAERSPAAAAAALSRVIAYAERSGKRLMLPAALLERSRCRRHTADAAGAEADLLRAAGEIEQRRARTAEPDFRDSVLHTATAIYENLVDLRLARGDDSGAFDAAERMRTRRMLESAGAADEPIGATRLTTALPPRHVIASYVTAGDHLTIFTLQRGRPPRAVLTVPALSVDAAVRDLQACIRRGDEVRAEATLSSLYTLLASPFEEELADAERLVVLPDDTTAGVPFAALFDAHRKQFLIERLQVVIAPSATTYVRGASLPPVRGTTRALVVGAPAIEAAVYPELAPLAGAAAEAQSVARIYGVEPLVGSEATSRRVAASLAEHDVIHIAAHALPEPSDASHSSLILAPAGDHGALEARDIAAMHLTRRPIVVLAGCGTATNADAADGVRSLALAFLAGGARSVIATQWEIDDAAASRVTVQFHRALSAGVPSAQALRESQLAELRATRQPFATVRTWAAFAIHGSGN